MLPGPGKIEYWLGAFIGLIISLSLRLWIIKLLFIAIVGLTGFMILKQHYNYFVFGLLTGFVVSEITST